jgi:tRNA nucleotidyltransferase/poly(A) polymerase
MALTAPPGCYPPADSAHSSKIRLILEFVQNSRNSTQAWLVGGCVRDWLLHRESNDLDLIVAEGASGLARALADAFEGSFFVLDRERDVARAILSDPNGKPLSVDIARLRAAELLVDLSLRDFTVNAMAVPVTEMMGSGHGALAEIVDPFDGRSDLEQGLVRAVTEGAFSDDPLRMLRAVRQAAELGFQIEDATYNLVRRDASLLAVVAAERVRDELWRIVSCPGGWRQLRILLDTGLLVQCLPEVSALANVTQSSPHYQDVFDHTRSVLVHLEGLLSLIWPAGGWRLPQDTLPGALPILGAAAWEDLEAVIRPYSADLQCHLAEPVSRGRRPGESLAWAALAHDWGKPDTRSVDQDGKIRFLGHAERGVVLAQTRLRALRMAADEVALVARLVGLHMRPGHLSNDFPPSRRAVYRFFLEAAGAGPECVLLSLADYAAIQAGNPHLDAWDRRIGTAGLLLEDYFRKRSERVNPPLLLNGRQIMSAFDLAPGPQVGLLLQELREAQAAGEVTDAGEAMTWLARRVRRDEG